MILDLRAERAVEKGGRFYRKERKKIISHLKRVCESAAPMALGIMMGIPTQPFRAGLTFSGRPSGPQWILGRSPHQL
jgi:hypothetical protein